MPNPNLPQFFRYINPIIEVLRETGGSGRPGEIIDLVVEKLKIPDEEIAVTIKSGQSRVKNQIQWARFLLASIGFIDSSQRGVWSLTEKGYKENITTIDLVEIYKNRKAMIRNKKKTDKNLNDSDQVAVIDAEECIEKNDLTEDYRGKLLNILQSISPAGFERLCQRILRESGFEQVTVTGKSGDGGIDGIGILQVNAFVSFRVLFQCKRYRETSITPSHVRDFRGAMMGRADKGIIMTTGLFTKDAKAEARRDGVPPIELVDGEKLVEFFEKLELGLKPVTKYEVDEKFFEEYRE